MPTVVNANDGDTLCGLAIDAGFVDCQPLRDEPQNKGKEFLSRASLKQGDVVVIPDKKVKQESKGTNAQHVFVKKTAPAVSIRFVHGSPGKKYRTDDTLLFANVSQLQTDKGGNAADRPFPDQFEFQQPGHEDRDTLKVEVVDPAAGGSVQAVLQALKPVYKADGTVDHNVEFTGAELNKRKLQVDCKKVRSGVAYRSKYLRLVSDEADHDGTVGPVAANGFAPPAGSPKPAQTLLVTDMTDQGEPQVEILDQLVRATYVVQRCPGSPKCAATATISVGSDSDPRKPRNKIRIAVHVLKSTVGGAGIVSIPNAERRIHKWMRRVLAQVGLSPKLAQPVRLVDPVENMVAVGDPNGALAAGDGQFGFRLNAPGKPSQVIGPINPSANDSTATTANALAALVAAPYSARVSANPARFVDPVGFSATDIIITEASGAHVSIDQLVSSDSNQTLTVARPVVTNLQSWGGNNFVVGNPDQRAIIKNYDTGSDRIDIFVVQQVTNGDRGEAMMSGHTLDPQRAAVNEVKFSVFMIQSAMDGTDNDPIPLTHELGHVAAEIGHATSNNNELMCDKVSGNNAPGASKRIRDGLIRYDMFVTKPRFVRFNMTMRLRTEGAGLLDAW